MSLKEFWNLLYPSEHEEQQNDVPQSHNHPSEG